MTDTTDSDDQDSGVTDSLRDRLGRVVRWSLLRFRDTHRGLLGDYYHHGAEPAYAVAQVGIALSLWFNEPVWIGGCLALFALPALASSVSDDEQVIEEQDEQDSDEEVTV